MAKKEWWRGAVIYQIYPRSFFDSNKDGNGDIRGITKKMGYVAKLGVDGIWISPFFKSPMKDAGYDVSDYRDIEPMFGNLEDVKKMIEEAHKRGLKVFFDFVLTHSSNQHEWFEESRQSRDNPKADWYIWADPKPDGSPPNNWQAHFGGSAWTYDIRRGQYYFHNFLPEQPDINLRNPDVKKAIFDIARFWLDLGVDGFRLDAALHYFCDPQLKDNPVNPKPSSSWFDHPTPFTMQIHKHDIDIDATLAFLEELRAVLDEYPDRAAVAEIGGENGVVIASQYTDGPKRIHTAYTFRLTKGRSVTPKTVREAVEEFNKQGGDGWPSWAFSNHDVIRVASRWYEGGDGKEHDPRFSKNLMAMLCSLYGTVFIYQGEELGLPEADIPYEKIQDPMGKYTYPKWQGRDGCRTPIPWDDSKKHAGFSKAKETWLPVSAKHLELSVARQERDPDSMLNFTRSLLAWRKTQPALIEGKIEFHDMGDEKVLGFTRHHEDGSLLCIFNLSASAKTVSLPHGVNAPSAFGSRQAGIEKGGQIELPPYGMYFAPLPK